jgi:trigger factor
VNNLRAPIFEEKVVDFIVELAKADEKKVTPQELLQAAQPDDDEETGSAAAPA